MRDLVTTGNVFRSQETGQLLNPHNVRPKEASRVNVFGARDGARGVAPRAAGTIQEEDDEGRVVSSDTAVAQGEQANARETADTVSALARDVRSGNRAARTALTALAVQERARPDGGRQTVLRKLQQLGV